MIIRSLAFPLRALTVAVLLAALLTPFPALFAVDDEDAVPVLDDDANDAPVRALAVVALPSRPSPPIALVSVGLVEAEIALEGLDFVPAAATPPRAPPLI